MSSSCYILINIDIKAKQLDAVVSITNISPSKSFANVQHSNYNNCIEDTEVNNKPSTKPVRYLGNTAAVTVLSDSQHVGNLVDECLVDEENEKNGSLDSSQKQMSANGAKKCLFDQCDAEKSRPLSQSKNKNCVSFENGREEKQDAEKKMNSDCSDNVTVKKPDISECEMESENKTKLVVRKSCDIETVHSVGEKNTEQSNQAISSLSSNGPCVAVGNSCSDQGMLFFSMNTNTEGNTVEKVPCSGNAENVHVGQFNSIEKDRSTSLKKCDSERKSTNKRIGIANDALFMVMPTVRFPGIHESYPKAHIIHSA